MLTQRGAVHALQHSGHRVADGTADIGLPAAVELQLDEVGKGGRQNAEQPPAETTIDAYLPLSSTGGRNQLLPAPSLSMQLARLESHAAAGSELAADAQPPTARSRQSSRARRAEQPQPHEQDFVAHGAQAEDAAQAPRHDKVCLHRPTRLHVYLTNAKVTASDAVEPGCS